MEDEIEHIFILHLYRDSVIVRWPRAMGTEIYVWRIGRQDPLEQLPDRHSERPSGKVEARRRGAMKDGTVEEYVLFVASGRPLLCL